MTMVPRMPRHAGGRLYPVWLATVVVALFVAPNLLTLIGLSSPASAVLELTQQQLVSSLVGSLVFQVVLFAVAMLPLVLTGRLDGRLFGSVRPRWSVQACGAGVVTGLAATVGSYGANAALVALSGSQDQVEQQLLQDALTGGTALVLVTAIAVIAAPITEEVVFRGVFFRALADRFGAAVGVVVSATIFAVIHIEVLRSQPVALAGLFVIGAVLAEAYRRSDNLIVPVLGHVLFNATSLGLAVLLDRVARSSAPVATGLIG